MNNPVDLTRVISSEHIIGEDAEETKLLLSMLREAKEYMRSFRWCTSIVSEYLGYGVGGVIGLFLFKFAPPVNRTDEWLWVVVGDLPSAYFVVDDAPIPRSALEIYCKLMDEWADAVLESGHLAEAYPVNAAPTIENARKLQSRIKFIREQLIPELS